MILSGQEIRRQVGAGSIIIDPFMDDQVNPNSYNYRLGHYIGPLGDGGSSEMQMRIPEDGVLLKPGRVYLAHTLEIIGSDQYVTSLIGRSSVGRLGLYVQLSADLGNLGSAHCWTLELCVVQPLRIYSEMRIGQVSFWRPEGRIIRYAGRYTDYSLPADCLDNDLGLMRQ